MAVYEVEFADGVYEVEFPDVAPAFGPQANESIGETSLRALRETPRAIGNTISDAYDFITSPIDTISEAGAEKTARTIGSLGAGTAGAAALAPFGTLAGPAAPVAIPVLGAIGGGLGLLGFDLATDAATTAATGNDQIKDSDQYVNDLVYNITQGSAVGAAGGAATAGARGAVNKITRPFKTSTAEANVVNQLEKWEPNYAQKIDDAVAQNDLSPDPFFNQKSLAELIDSDVLRTNERSIARSGAEEFASANSRIKKRAADQLKFLDEIEQSPTTMQDVQSSIDTILQQSDDLKQRQLTSAEVGVQKALNQLPEGIDISEAGGLIREAATQKLDSTKANVSKSFDAVGDGAIDIASVKELIATELPRYFREVGEQPNGRLASLVDEINGQAQNIESGTGFLLDAEGQPIIREKPLTFKDVQAVRSKALDIAQSGDDMRSRAVAGKIAQSLDDSVQLAVERGTIQPDQYVQWEKARSLRREQGRVFESAATPTKSVLSKQPYGEFKVPESAVPSKYFKSGEKGAKEAVRNYKEVVGNMDPLYRYAANSFREYATKADGSLDAAKARSWISRHSSALSEMPELKQTLSNIDQAQTFLNEKFGELKRSQAEVEKTALKQMLEVDPDMAISKMLSGANPIRKTRMTVEFLKQRDPEAVSGLRRGVIEHIKKLTVQDEKIKGQTLLNTINKLRPVMEKSGLFSEAQIKGFEALYKDKKSELSIQNAKMAGGSDTFQNQSVLSKLKNIGTTSFLSTIPFGKYLNAVYPFIKEIPLAKFNSILEEALLDPRMARQLARKATAERMDRTVQQLFKAEHDIAFGKNIAAKTQITTGLKRVAPSLAAATQETITSEKSFPTPSEVYSPSDASLKKKDTDMARSPEFDAKVDQIAANLETDPEHLMKAMAFETGGTFDSDVTNKAGSGATGLIQFMPSTAQNLTGADTKQAAIDILKNLDEVEQLDYVEKYLKPFKGKLNSLSDVYMAILWPKAVGKDSQYALFREGTKAYWQNRGLDLDGDGIITKEEATQKVKNYRV